MTIDRLIAEEEEDAQTSGTGDMFDDVMTRE
jgi:hypothetical protein